MYAPVIGRWCRSHWNVGRIAVIPSISLVRQIVKACEYENDDQCSNSPSAYRCHGGWRLSWDEKILYGVEGKVVDSILQQPFCRPDVNVNEELTVPLNKSR